jgi:beta-lactamase regulating signal transducer with metallopeptidase domain
MNLIDASFRAVLLAAVAGLFLAIARWRGKLVTASFEHALWTCVLAGMLAFALPKFTVRTGTPAARPSGVEGFLAPKTLTVTALDTRPVVIHYSSRTSWILGVWLVGALGMMFRMALGLALTRRGLAGARPVMGEAAVRSAVSGHEGVTASVEESEAATVPCAVGWPDARIVLPVTWREWTAEKVRAAIDHELAHVRRQDLLVRYLSGLNRAIFWFHPLAWWLDRRLAELAEFAADEAALASSAGDRHAYAEVLVEMAAVAQPVERRWASASVEFAQRGFTRMNRRVGRVLDSRLRSGPMKLVWAAGLLVAAVTLVRLERPLMAQANTPQIKDSLYYVANVRDQFMRVPPNVRLPFENDITAEQAASLEQKLSANPEDEKARVDLSAYYFTTSQADKRVALVNWMIEHHPESTVHSLMSMSVLPRRDGGAAYTGAVERWHAQLAAHPNDANVLLNAAKAIGQANVNEEIELLKRAQSIDHDRFTALLVQLYGETLAAGPMGRAEGLAMVREEVARSSDAALIGGTGALMVERAVLSMDRPSYDWQAVRSMALDLLARAQSLEPSNQKWTDAAEGARRMPGPLAATATASPAGAPMRIRIGAKVAQSNLITANFQVTIGTDGHVTQVTLVSGPPALVQAAIAAVSQYVYKPTLLNGKPVEVQTTVEVVF